MVEKQYVEHSKEAGLVFQKCSLFKIILQIIILKNFPPYFKLPLLGILKIDKNFYMFCKVIFREIRFVRGCC